MSKTLRLAIVSDLHCTDNPARRKLTHLHPDTPGVPVSRHPVEALKKLIKDDGLKVDILLCPGDITDQINNSGFYAGWRYLEEIGSALSVGDNIFATLGNHDVNSRIEKPGEAFVIAKNLRNNYPVPTAELQASYWGEHFCIVEKEDYRLFIFNSVHDHYNLENCKSISLDIATLHRIDEQLTKTDKTKIGIAMSHHHPISHASIDYQDTDIIDKGDQLLAILQKNGFTFYLHGHKHEPVLRSINGLAVLGAGSFSSLENLKETQSENMFHIVEIEQHRGIIESWDYGIKSGWHKKNGSSSFPNLAGYGYFGTIQDLAERINTWLEVKESKSSNLKFLAIDIAEIFYLRPDQQKELEQQLENQHEIEIMPNISFGKKASINKILK